jgi:2-oxoisovalerate dehydrogenase E1 component
MMTNTLAPSLAPPVRLTGSRLKHERQNWAAPALEPAVDWPAVARLLLTSRQLDQIEEQELLPAGMLRYQFSARGHELAQILLGLALDHPHDAATVYYRSRPFMLASGLTAEESFCGTMARAGSPNGGRDIGTVFNMPARGRATVLPMTGDVGGQYTPAAGWAQTIRYRADVLGQADWQGAVAVAMGGDGSTATAGFWSALNIASTLGLPLLFLIEDNGYAISVPSTLQFPGGDLMANLAAYQGILLLDGDGAEPIEAAQRIAKALAHVRAGRGAALLRLRVPRLNGHSSADNQSYKDDATMAAEWERDPLRRLRALLLDRQWCEREWDALAGQAESEVRQALERALAQPEPNPATSCRFTFFEAGCPQKVGGCAAEDLRLNADDREDASGSLPSVVDLEGAGGRANMVDAIRRTLETELRANPRMVVFGEDVGRKGGVHGATRDLQRAFGPQRVFDTSLSEEGIIGRAVGMALGGLLPVPEIQFRKYADPAMEQLTDCGTIRWRSNNNFAAPMVVRIPLGFSKRSGDPWHSISGEAIFAHTLGWRIAFPANAADAAGLLRAALRGNDPVFFLEHRALLDTPDGRAAYPGDDYVLPFGQAAIRQAGDLLTIVTWGAMVQRCVEAAARFGGDVEIIDLRTIIPWDRAAVLESVRKTSRCLVVHEDTWTAGFGGEIAAAVAQEAFAWLDAPITRLATPDCPVPYSAALMSSVIPTVGLIQEKIEELLRY